jgi:hypothetical protein
MRKELRDLHIETSAKGGSVFNLLRQHLHSNHTNLPKDIEEAFNEASALMDRLGLLEAKYDAAEANYNTLEWSYSNKETRFVEETLNNRLAPVGTLSRSRSADDLEVAQLTSGMTDRDREIPTAWNHTMYHETRDFGDDTSAPTESDQEDEPIKALQESQRHVSHDNDYLVKRPTKEEAVELPKGKEHTRWLRKMKRIDAWLLETVDDSRLLQAYLKAIYDVGYSDDEKWWKHTSQLLTENYDEVPLFRTGDSTVSHQTTTSKPGTPPIVRRLSQDLPIVKIVSTSSPVSETDAPAGTMVSKCPARSESEDLAPANERETASLGPPARSLSISSNSCMTSELPSRRTSCSEIADTQSDATSQCSEAEISPVGQTRTVCVLTCCKRERCSKFQEIYGCAGESSATTPTQQGQYDSTSSGADKSPQLDNASQTRRENQPNSAVLTSRLETLPESIGQSLSQEDNSQPSIEQPSVLNPPIVPLRPYDKQCVIM